MSIVEKALQKAQAIARQAATGAAAPEPAAGPVLGREDNSEPSDPRSGPREDSSSQTSRDLKAMVQLDVALLREAGRLPSVRMARQVNDEMRRIKWPLLNAIAGRENSTPARNNVVLVTSALPGEGKTFTSLCLALSIVRDREMRVVLVDGDVARPGLTPTLGLEGRLGLNDVLDDVSRDISDVTYRTDVPGLFFVPAGRWHDHSPEFFAGSRMPEVISELSKRVGNGVIVFDSPPLLATNDAQAVTRYVGQMLLVVRADETEQQAVRDALALVDKDLPVLCVLNKVEASMLSRYYGHYYYGYHYGHSGAERGQPTPEMGNE